MTNEIPKTEYTDFVGKIGEVESVVSEDKETEDKETFEKMKSMDINDDNTYLNYLSVVPMIHEDETSLINYILSRYETWAKFVLSFKYSFKAFKQICL